MTSQIFWHSKFLYAGESNGRIIIFRLFWQSELEKIPKPDAFIIMYSVIDKASFQRAQEHLARLHDQDLLRGRPAILVGNKVDLVRSKVVSPEGMY